MITLDEQIRAIEEIVAIPDERLADRAMFTAILATLRQVKAEMIDEQRFFGSVKQAEPVAFQCTEGNRCVCGGDTPAVRATCQNMKPIKSAPQPIAWVVEENCLGQFIEGRARKVWWECNKGVGTPHYAFPQPEGVSVTLNEQGQAVAVTRIDEDHRILSVIWEAPQPVAAPDGWVMVPKEPTDGMIVALCGVPVVAGELGGMTPIDRDGAIQLYRAMLAAAPAAPQSVPAFRKVACFCEACDLAVNVMASRMSVCPKCGDKRCARAKYHDNACSTKAAPGREG